jgi:hypothetical protein
MAHLMKIDSTLDTTQLSKLSHAAREQLLDALALRHLRAHLEALEAAQTPRVVTPNGAPHATR